MTLDPRDNLPAAPVEPRELDAILAALTEAAAEIRARRQEFTEAELALEAAQAKHGERLVELSRLRDVLRREAFARLNIATGGGWYQE